MLDSEVESFFFQTKIEGALKMEWVAEELGSIDLGDKRLNERVCQVLKKLSQNPADSIPTACGSWQETKAAYRLFDNKRISPDKVLEPHQAATLQRMKACETILLLQDTTTLTFSTQKQREDIGPIQTDTSRGLFLHPLVAVTPERLCLGVLNCQQWRREKLAHKTPKERKKANYERSIEEKESYRWIIGYRKACEYASILPSSKIVSISDREGDLYDLYEEAQQTPQTERAYWLTRVHYNRAELNSEGNKSGDKIREAAEKTKSVGLIEFVLPNNHPQKGRRVTQAVYVKKVFLSSPDKRKKTSNDKVVEATVIVAKEINVPNHVESIEWILLTNLSVVTYEEACEKIQWYLCRWEIEIYFKILKSGCNVEKLQLSDNNFDICLRLYMIIAWRILFVTMLGRACPEMSCEIVFSSEEWQTAFILTKKTKPPEKALSLNEMIKMLASLGGYMNRKSDPMPGVKTIWIGLRNLQEHIKAREAFSAVYGHTYG